MVKVPLHCIRTDGGTQPRAELNLATVNEYAEAMAEGAVFPPVTVFQNGREYWLADGFHRVHAARKAGLAEIAADLRQGTRRDAVLFSVGANADHGLHRSNDDKRRAVMTLLTDDEWSRWPQTKIAQACRVHRQYVCLLAATMDPSCRRGQDGIRDVTRAGTTYPMDTSAMSRRKSGPLGPTGSSIVTKAEYEGGAAGPEPAEPAQPTGPAQPGSPARPPRKPTGGVSPDAFQPVLGHSNPPPMVALSLPRQNPLMAANTLIELFDPEWLAAVARRISDHLEKGLSVCPRESTPTTS